MSTAAVDEAQTGERRVRPFAAEWGGDLAALLLRAGVIVPYDERVQGEVDWHKRHTKGYRYSGPAILPRDVKELVRAGLLPVFEIGDREYLRQEDLDRIVCWAREGMRKAAESARVPA